LRALLAEGCVRERLERLVQRRELVRDPDEALSGLEAPVERVDLVAQTVESFEDGVELTVVEVLPLRHFD
jgi:hypothetical protein